MRTDERRRGMPGNHAIALLQQCPFGNRRRRETPVRMCGQFLVTLVLCIDRIEERSGIGGVKHDRQAKLATFRKDRREPLVIDAQQLAIGTPHRQPEVLPELDAARAVLDQAMQPVDRHLHKVVPLHAVPIHPADGGKAIGRGRMIAIHNVQRSLPHLHGDIHHVFHAASIHNGEHVFRVHRVQMIVIIDHWKARLFDRVHYGLKR